MGEARDSLEILEHCGGGEDVKSGEVGAREKLGGVGRRGKTEVAKNAALQEAGLKALPYP